MTTTVAERSSFTRPAVAHDYVDGDLVANSAVAGEVVPLSWVINQGGYGARITRMRIRTSGSGGGEFRLHLYGRQPTVVGGDGELWQSDQAAAYLGSCDVRVDEPFTDGSAGDGTPNGGPIGVGMSGASTEAPTVYGLVEALEAYSAQASEQWTVVLEALQD